MKTLKHTNDSLNLYEFLERYPKKWHSLAKDKKTAKAFSSICDMMYETAKEMGQTEQARADAAFIVRAVNCHEELVTVLKDLAHYCKDQIDQTAFQVRIKIAIAKAEGK